MNWKTKFVSATRKEILQKSVVMALLVYCISCFILSKGVCSEITKKTATFWWSQGENEKKNSLGSLGKNDRNKRQMRARV